MRPTQPENPGCLQLTNVLSRNRVSLDGQWKSIVDPYEMGYLGLFGDRNERGFFRDFSPRDPGDRVEYSFDESPELAVPGDWNTQRPELLYYEGTVWYRRKVELDSDLGPDRLFLHIGAANHTSRVFWDGQELATHVGGFGPYAVELTDLAASGEHSLVIQVDNRRELNRIPALRSDWWNFGGLTRSVHLVRTPATFLRDAWISMNPAGRVVGGYELDGSDSGQAVTVSLPGMDVAAEVSSQFELDIDPERWNPGAPVLHEVVWASGDDAISTQVGFRTVRTEGTTIVVNDVPTVLRGISIHAETPSGGRRAHGPTDASILLGWAQELNANFVRLAHYQHDEHMLLEADRRGLLTWCELPVYWGIAFNDPAVLANARAQLDELIQRDRSRASIILWSVANETMTGPDRDEFLTDLVSHGRRVDDTRLMSCALFTEPTNESDHHITDPLAESLDVIAVNQYMGWYYGDQGQHRQTPAGPPECGKADRLHRVGRRGQGGVYTENRTRSGPRNSKPRSTPRRSRCSAKADRSGRNVAVDPQGLSGPGPGPPRDPGRLQPQGARERGGGAKTGLRCPPQLLRSATR